jgi:hypothetical protein
LSCSCLLMKAVETDSMLCRCLKTRVSNFTHIRDKITIACCFRCWLHVCRENELDRRGRGDYFILVQIHVCQSCFKCFQSF